MFKQKEKYSHLLAGTKLLCQKFQFKTFTDDYLPIFTDFKIKFFKSCYKLVFRELPKDLKSSLDSYKSPHSWQRNGKCFSTI